MSSLHLYLAEGFANDHVVVEVDGRKVLDADGVTTKKLTGLAMQIAPVAVQGQRSRVGVRLPRKGLDAAFEVDLGKGSHVPISIENGQLSHSVHRQIGFM
ncbi:MAG TPA: hypothetical protein VE443_00585 [Beijerinckiaceae bacterium]|nr:hypothetical protein [Beijerinckiaceae bacterium]